MVFGFLDWFKVADLACGVARILDRLRH